jgi:hypothetical protein
MQNFAQFFWLDPVFVWQVSLSTEMFYVQAKEHNRHANCKELFKYDSLDLLRHAQTGT